MIFKKKKQKIDDMVDMVGNIYEFITSKGLIYIQFVYCRDSNHDDGEVVSVLRGVYRKRPTNFKNIIDKGESFYANIYLDNEVKLKEIVLVGKGDVPKKFTNQPKFLETRGIEADGKASVWFLNDGRRTKKIGKMLPKEYHTIPISSITPISNLKLKIEAGWLPKNDVAIWGFGHKNTVLI